MATVFDDWTYEDARSTVAEKLPEDAEVNKLFYTGDHWQDGDGWIGPQPAVTDDEAETVWAEIEKAFVSKNAIAEVIDRHANAIIGTEPAWSFTLRRALAEDEQPSADEQALIEEAEAALTEWWDSRKQILLELQRAIRAALWGERVCLRLYVPFGLTISGDVGETRVPSGTLTESLEKIFLEVVEFDRGCIERAPDTQQEIGVYLFADKDNLGLQSDEPQDFAELHYLDDDGKAVIRIIGAVKTAEGSRPADTDIKTTLDLNGNLAFEQIKLNPFITAQIRSQNKLLNMACTMMGRNVVLGGFLERVILNAQLPGQWVNDPDNPGKKKFQPEAFRVGAGSTNALAGIPIYGDPSRPTQITGYTSPSVIYRDPVDPTSFITTKETAYSDILDETRQRHVLINRDATASGESRKQARADFKGSLDATKTAMDRAGRWLLETALAMAANFSGQAERFKGLRAVFECQLNLGPISAEESQQVINERTGGLISRQTAMTRIGVDDPDAEEAQIKAEALAGAQEQAQINQILGVVPGQPGNAGGGNAGGEGSGA